MNTTPPPLVIAAHGTRLPEGQAGCRALVARVAALLPGVDVRAGYVELDHPPIADAVADSLSGGHDAVVLVPLMLGAGGHVRDDIPRAAEEGRSRVPGSRILLASHLGPEPGLRGAVRRRIAEAEGDWEPGEIAVVFLGRGCSVTDANAEHARLARQLGEEGGYGLCVPAFIQVVRPTLADGLTQAYSVGFRRLVVAPNFLFPGLLHRWSARDVVAWMESHPDAEVRLADVIGDCDELAAVVARRYQQAAAADPDADAPTYLAGLALRGRRVLVVGAGAVASRRMGRLLEAGAALDVVAPEATPYVAALAAEGRLVWHRRPFGDADLDGAWYALALTDVAAVNEAVAAGAEARRIFCVRGDDARGGSAATPASGTGAGLTVGVLGGRNPRRTARARDVAIEAVLTWAAQEAGQD